MKHTAGMYMGAVVALIGIIWGCNAITTPDGQGLLVDTGFTNAGPGTGGAVQTGGGTPIEGTDDVELPAEETRSFFTAFRTFMPAKEVVEHNLAPGRFPMQLSPQVWPFRPSLTRALRRTDAQGNVSNVGRQQYFVDFHVAFTSVHSNDVLTHRRDGRPSHADPDPLIVARLTLGSAEMTYLPSPAVNRNV